MTYFDSYYPEIIDRMMVDPRVGHTQIVFALGVMRNNGKDVFADDFNRDYDISPRKFHQASKTLSDLGYLKIVESKGDRLRIYWRTTWLSKHLEK